MIVAVWEADLVLGKQDTDAIVTLAERKIRIYLTKKVFSKGAVEVSKAIAKRWMPEPILPIHMPRMRGG